MILTKPKLLTGIIIALFFGIALYLRACLPYDQVVSGEWIKFTGTDAYYHMRIVDNLAHNFPHLMGFDPYFIYPAGHVVGSISFFDWLLASIIWVIGLGSPTQHTVGVVGVYFPTVLGALTVIPVYFIGKELFGRWAGVLSAGLIALLPGEFLGRSILGFTDHHVAETLFTTITILFLILAVKTARQKQLTFNHLYHRDWAAITKPIIYSLLAGIFLGTYLLTWSGALLFVFIISIYFIIQFIIDHLKHKSTDYLCLVGVILFFVSLVMFLPVSPGRLSL
ncbi:STT3 domain-containing protein, partial [Chloroflexota bacterium]